ncbi:MAG: RloB family protein [Minicystis sp.]
MPPKIRRTGLVDRRIQHRDATIFVLATEGTETERQYFLGLQARGIIDRSRIHLEVIATPREDTTSAPKHVLARLADFATRYRLIEGMDELWLVIDVDRWPEQQLSEVAQEASQKRFSLAVSNPCFELWLLLHLRSEVAEIRCCDDCAFALRATLGAYNKSRLDMDQFPRALVESALQRAAAVDDAGERWPTTTGSHVHRLVRRLLEV